MFLRFRKKTNISDLVEGSQATVEGEVVPRDEILLSGSRTKCVYYDKLSEVYETGTRGRGRKMWVPKNLEKKCAGFFVSDGTGQVWVGQDTDGLYVEGGKQESAVVGKKGNLRYLAQLVQRGDLVRIRGCVGKPKGADPGDGWVIRQDKKGRLPILVKKQS